MNKNNHMEWTGGLIYCSGKTNIKVENNGAVVNCVVYVGGLPVSIERTCSYIKVPVGKEGGE